MAGLQLPSTRGLRNPLRLNPLRAAESAALDTDDSAEIPPFTPWHTFLQDWAWEQGDHVTLVGRTKSGKTTLARQLLFHRHYVVVLATKVKDSSLYTPLQRHGFKVVTDFPAVDPSIDPTDAKVIFKPPLDSPTGQARMEQAEAFQEALIEIFRDGGWCVYSDEVRYLSKDLGLATELETLMLQGRSLGVSMVAATQRPVSIPLVFFTQATHLFLYRTSELQDVKRAAEFTGDLQEMVRYVLPRLPMHEVLYIDTATGQTARTKVKL